MNKSNKYPKLMKHLRDGSTLVVMFTDKRTGYVVLAGNDYCLGFASMDWWPSDFEDYNGVITLTNQVFTLPYQRS